MAVTYPYSIAFLADTLRIKTAITDIQRNDELSGTGDGRIWQAELAPPLWTLTVGLALDTHDKIKQVAAKIRKLHGAQEPFYMYDTMSKYPQADPKGIILGSSTVTATITSNKSIVAFTGLPVGYKITVGDKFTILNSMTNKPHYHEASETVLANSSGVATFACFPHLSTNLDSGNAVILKKPYGRFIIVPDSFAPGTGEGLYTEGAGFKAIEKK